MDGAFLVNKPRGISSFGVIEVFQKYFQAEFTSKTGSRPKRKHLPKFGHGGTLDPFATGLLVVLVGRGVKLARYFLGSEKGYEGVIRFGQATTSGDPTCPVTETSPVLPTSREQIQEFANRYCEKEYLQTPPMHSAKKRNGVPLYELARQGIEVERKPKSCQLYQFYISSFESPTAQFELQCSSGTYVRTLAEDLGKSLNTVAMLDSLHRTTSGIFSVSRAWTPEKIVQALESGQSETDLSCWVPFDQLLDTFPRAVASWEECDSLQQGRQNVLFHLLKRTEPPKVLSGREHTNLHASLQERPVEKRRETDKENYVAIFHSEKLIGVAHRAETGWGIERVFLRDPKEF